ncbi:MAG TPA: urease accessory protein [Rhizobiales bacterium]|nr:urease accessory protein [Hyphomicrobiales bacterium]
MISILLFGFLLGMRHAVEADHIAAVASLTSTTGSVRRGVQQGMAWGLGHTLTLFLFGSIVLFVANIVPEQVVSKIELAVGVMLIILGADVLRRVIVERVHFHLHTHGLPQGKSQTHFHAHSHKGEQTKPHELNPHQHIHTRGFPLKALLVGLMHGMAGSAALILLTLQTLDSAWLGLIYIAVFGVGSIAGMGLFSLVIAIPLRAARRMTWLYNGLQAIIGTTTIGLGLFTISQYA